MPTEKQSVSKDPRVIKTNHKLRDALVTFLRRHSLEEVTVVKITKLAKVTRGTFYLHYKDKDDFLYQMQQNILSEFFEASIAYGQAPHITVAFPHLNVDVAFRYIFENATTFNTLLNQQKSLLFYDKLADRLTGYYREYIQITNHDSIIDQQLPLKQMISFYVSAFSGFVGSWLQGKMVYSADFMAKVFMGIIQDNGPKDNHFKNFFQISKKD